MATTIDHHEPNPHHGGGAEALRMAAGKDGKDKQYGVDITRHRTEVEKQVIELETQADEIVHALEVTEQPNNLLPKIDLFLPDVLKDAVFVGHVVTDLDSVAGAIGAACLYGGTPALASPINSETMFAFQEWGAKMPQYVEDILEEAGPDNQPDICLVDHQQTSQLNPCIPVDRIVGVIDHHALQSKTIVTDKPIYIDIRPWGSMSTIVAHTFLTHKRRPPKDVAGMLLSAILSDTLNLLGPTTTKWDRLMVAVLADICNVDDIQLLASRQFKAKSRDLASLSAVGLVNGDQKSFSFQASGFNGEIGFAVVETTDDQVILDRIDELLPEMVLCKKENGYTCIFLAIVNIVKLHSKLLLCGPTEQCLAEAAFGGTIISGSSSSADNGNLMDLGNRVSRKKDFIPAITSTIKKGWTKPKDIKRGPSSLDLDIGHLEVDPNDPYGKVERVVSDAIKKEGPNPAKKQKLRESPVSVEHELEG